MFKFSKRSEANLCTCHPDIIRLCKELIKHVDFAVLEGHRIEEDQNKAFENGFSKLQWPDSMHNTLPSLAVDLMPTPIDWDDHKRNLLFVGFVLGVAKMMGIELRSGADWNRNFNPHDQKLFDVPHFELVLDAAPTILPIVDPTY